MQGGAGAYTLCESCNNNTGAWYGGEYVKWARTCRDIMVMWNQKQTLSGSVELKNVYPLRFLKQIVACFCSLRASDGTFFIEKYPELVPFILDKNNENLPSGLRFFMNLYIESPEVTQLRRVGVAIRAKVKDNLEIIKSVPFGEITHPPFQLIMTYDYGTFDDATEITIFQNFSYDQISNVEIPLRIVLSDNPLAGMG